MGPLPFLVDPDRTRRRFDMHCAGRLRCLLRPRTLVYSEWQGRTAHRLRLPRERRSSVRLDALRPVVWTRYNLSPRVSARPPPWQRVSDEPSTILLQLPFLPMQAGPSSRFVVTPETCEAMARQRPSS